MAKKKMTATTLVDHWVNQLKQVPWRSQVSTLRWRADKTPHGRKIRVMTGCPRRLFDDHRFLPTPTHRDYKDVGDPTTSKGLHENARRRMLGAVLVVASGRPGALNSDFARLMMGYPRGWLVQA